jgi:hypothetical protein
VPELTITIAAILIGTWGLLALSELKWPRRGGGR